MLPSEAEVWGLLGPKLRDEKKKDYHYFSQKNQNTANNFLKCHPLMHDIHTLLETGSDSRS
jgi:hypothetical protein